MIKHEYEPRRDMPREKKVSRLKQCNKSNRLMRRYYSGVRHRVLVPAAAPAKAA